ncbi:hypothetical protein SD37_25640 [Amycolatopsis orientalis]|uniref:Uncharacterized protein n=1 Tax=Amycolatopsis orientalis TaxID=31958 RepID=A0A193C2R5_AMYOR|nr:hypothetical protein SD37_25640 [Amycolatopsis orientalis]
MRRWLELLSLGGLAVVGFAVGIAQQLGWLDKVAAKGVTTLTLIMVIGVVVVLLIELTPFALRRRNRGAQTVSGRRLREHGHHELPEDARPAASAAGDMIRF